MARPKAFDPPVVLQKALQVFWSRGYHATSLSDLEREMGIGRKSLYDTFGSKQGLFLQVLDAYLSKRPPIEAVGAGWAAIQATLTGGPPYDPRHQSCLMVNTTVEDAAASDAQVAERIELHRQLLVTGFERALARAIADGDLPEQDVSVAALYLCTTLQGLSVMSRSGVPPEQLRAIAGRALDSLAQAGVRS